MITILAILNRHGLGKEYQSLGSIHLANQGTGGSKRTYKVTQMTRLRSDDETPPRTVKVAEVKDFPSTQVSIWKLVHTALEALGHQHDGPETARFRARRLIEHLPTHLAATEDQIRVMYEICKDVAR